MYWLPVFHDFFLSLLPDQRLAISNWVASSPTNGFPKALMDDLRDAALLVLSSTFSASETSVYQRTFVDLDRSSSDRIKSLFMDAAQIR